MHLQPRTVTAIVDGSFHLYRKNFVTFLGIAALFSLPLLALQSLLGLQFAGSFFDELLQLSQSVDPGGGIPPTLLRSATLLIGGVVALALVQTLLVLPLLYGALCYAAASQIRGEAPTIAATLRGLGGSVWSLLGFNLIITILSTLFIGGLVALIGVPIALLAAQSGMSEEATIAGILGLVALSFMLAFASIALILALAPRLILSYCVIVVEGLGPLAAMRRSWSLVRGFFWRILGVYLLLSILSSFIAGIPAVLINQIILIVLGLGGADSFEALVSAQILQMMSSTLFSMLAQPLTFAGLTLAYFDLRVRKEAYDLELQMQASE